MATVKAVLFISKTLSNGEHPLMIRVTKDRKSKYIATGRSCPPELWDVKNNRPANKHPLRKELSIFLKEKVTEAERQILNLENDKSEFTAEVIASTLKQKPVKKTVFNYFDEIVKAQRAANQIGNSQVYGYCKRVLKRFRGNRDLNFSDIDLPFLTKLEQYLWENDFQGNSIYQIMRTLRAVVNKAISDKLMKKDLYPFENYKVTKLQTETQKRALTKEQMKGIVDLNIQPDSPLFNAYNYFLFSYYLQGINFIDIANLSWTNIINGRLVYQRIKTGKLYNVVLLEPALKILEHYKSISNQTDYIFPILDKSVHKTALQKEYRTTKMIKRINSDLKEIGKKCTLPFELTTYVARHTFATVMKRSGAPTAVISEAMGHRDEKTTQTYLDSFENGVIDKAVEALLI